MSDKDDRLNPLSSNFDPLAALYSSAVELPDPDAPVLDNLTRFEITSSGVEIRPSAYKKEEPKKTEEEEEKTPEDIPEEIPSTSQLPEPSRGKGKNVLLFMKDVNGPLSCLRDSMERNARIKVTTRSDRGVRGYVTAYVAAFDKMWNLALEDVTEVWTRRRKKKIPCLHPTSGGPEWRVVPPRVTVTRLGRKTERCERRVPKMMMRGEHIVHIQIIE